MQGVVERLRQLVPDIVVRETGEPDQMIFRLPPELRALRTSRQGHSTSFSTVHRIRERS